jgi:hypothetical protein
VLTLFACSTVESLISLARSMRAACEIATIPAMMMTIPRIEKAAISFLATERLERRMVWIP